MIDVYKRQTFYRTLKGEAALDEKGIVDGFARGLDNRLFPFATAARRFQLIETPAVTVYIPLDEGAALVEELRQGRRSRALFRRLGRYGVNVYPDHRQALEKAGLLERLDEEVLVLADPRCYDTHTGLPPVSYTHLDVYKRQQLSCERSVRIPAPV